MRQDAHPRTKSFRGIAARHTAVEDALRDLSPTVRRAKWSSASANIWAMCRTTSWPATCTASVCAFSSPTTLARRHLGVRRRRPGDLLPRNLPRAAHRCQTHRRACRSHGPAEAGISDPLTDKLEARLSTNTAPYVDAYISFKRETHLIDYNDMLLPPTRHSRNTPELCTEMRDYRGCRSHEGHDAAPACHRRHGQSVASSLA